jgi:hypothetical protein
MILAKIVQIKQLISSGDTTRLQESKTKHEIPITASTLSAHSRQKQKIKYETENNSPW